ncbi:MAG: helix-turn-helix transcriptional regulator [Blautia sp.]|nr:helix-turn-helix transcriptional regulator [Blautia sp.]
MTIKQLRLERGYSQRELSMLAGVNYRTYQDYEQGKKPLSSASGDVLLRLSTALGCDVVSLLFPELTEGTPLLPKNSISEQTIQAEHFYCPKYKVWGRWVLADGQIATLFYYNGQKHLLPFKALFTNETFDWLKEAAVMQMESAIDEIEFQKRFH